MFQAAHSVPTNPSRSTALARRWWTITGARLRRRGRSALGWRLRAGVFAGRRAVEASVAAGPRFAGAVGGLEAVAAAAGLDRVGVVDGEAAAHELVDEVDLGAV